MKYSGMLTPIEAQALQTCVNELQENAIVIQIGANAGLSTVAMLSARPDIFIFSIDIKPCNEEKINLFNENLPLKQVVRVLGDSQEMGFPFRCDMLYIDGDHRYQGVKADYLNWKDKVRDWGLIVFHDYMPKGAPPKNQVYEVVQEFYKDTEPFIQAERIIGFRV